MFGELCVRCKGRLWCGLPKCPILESAARVLPKIEKVPDSIFGPSPSIFVGRIGYPNVFAGPLVSEDRDRVFTSTSQLYGKSLDEIVASTSVLLRTSKRVNVRRADSKIVEVSQEIAMSDRAVDTEVFVERFYRTPSIDDFFHPTGPTVLPRKVDIVDNPHIPRRVDMVVEERLKATQAVRELYFNGLDVDYLQKIMAAGVLGKERRMVPTRWSITAVDDTVSKEILKEVKRYDTIGSVELYENTFMGNEFHIFLIPGSWEYEMIESWLRGSLYAPDWGIGARDYEPFEGRKDYASNITGAYYAARLGVAEHLARRRRQAKVLIYREITPDYKLPLGVWVIREAVRDAMRRKPLLLESVWEGIELIEPKVRVKDWSKESKILYNLKHQRRLEDFYE